MLALAETELYFSQNLLKNIHEIVYDINYHMKQCIIVL